MNISIRPLKENDLPEADHIFRLAFGTFIGLSDPMTFSGDADYIRTRFYSDPLAAYAAEIDDGRLIGSNFTANWGSVGFFGPLTIHPDYWSQGIANILWNLQCNYFLDGILNLQDYSHLQIAQSI